MQNSLRIGKIFGIPIGLNYSWFFIFFLLTWLLAQQVYPEKWHWSTRLVVAVATSLLFFGSVVAHELSHSVVAIRFGIPVKSITLFIFGGVAQIAKEAPRPRVEILVALAGPLMSFFLGGVLLGLWKGFESVSDHFSRLAYWLGVINIQLAIFNMVPGFPLDGGRVFRGVVWAVTGNFQRATRWAALLGRAIAWLFIIGGIAAFVASGDPSLLWLSFIGWFLESAASTSYSQMRVRESLRGFSARDIMSQNFVTIPPQLNIYDLVQNYVLMGGWRYFVVASNGEFQGILTIQDLRRLPRNKWLTSSVGQVMIAKERLRVVSPLEEALSLLESMDQQRLTHMPVAEDGRIIGVVGREEMMRFLQTRAELKV